MWLEERRIEGGQDLELDQEAGSEEKGKDRSAAGGGMGAQEPPVTTGFGWRRSWWWHAAGSTRGGGNAKRDEVTTVSIQLPSEWEIRKGSTLGLSGHKEDGI